MSDPTLQEILTHFHEKGYKDATLAKVVGLSQPTINNIRNGKQSGNRTQDKFSVLIHAFLNNEELTTLQYTPPKQIGTPKPISKPSLNNPINNTDETSNKDKTYKEENGTQEVTTNFHPLTFIIPLIVLIFILFLMQRTQRYTKRVRSTDTTPIPIEATPIETSLNPYFPQGYRDISNLGF